MGGWVYILTNKPNGTLYIGVTSKIGERIAQHRSKAVAGFTRDHGLERLVYLEAHDRIEDAIAREKALKHWRRAWKVRLIQSVNPDWRDLANDINV